MLGRHISIRVICCGMCPFAEISINENSRLPSLAFVKCTDLRKDLGSIETAMKGIDDQCRFPKATDVKDIIG